MAPLSGPGTPYITPALLRSAPTGIDWTSIPNSRSSTLEQQAEQTNICLRATGMVDIAANQVLRASLDTEFFRGPDWRVTVDRHTLEARIQCGRWPILQVVSVQVSPSWNYPRTWTTIPPAMIDIDRPAMGILNGSQPSDASDGGSAILLGPGSVSWWMGRNGWRIAAQYINGWPHTALTAAVSAGATSLPVDDCTGWAPIPAGGASGFAETGAVGIIYDGLRQEVVSCNAASAVSGPGNLTIGAPIGWDHPAGTLISCLPAQVQNAAIDFATSMALERGATATVIQSVSGSGGSTGGPVDANTLREWATKAVQPFGRVI